MSETVKGTESWSPQIQALTNIRYDRGPWSTVESDGRSLARWRSVVAAIQRKGWAVATGIDTPGEQWELTAAGIAAIESYNRKTRCTP